MVSILLADDSPTDRAIFGGLLEKQSDLRVSHANDGARGLEEVRKNPPDLIVTDMRMPEMDGLELVRTMRTEFKQIPVILLYSKS